MRIRRIHIEVEGAVDEIASFDFMVNQIDSPFRSRHSPVEGWVAR